MLTGACVGPLGCVLRAGPEHAAAISQLCQAHAAFERTDCAQAGHAQRLATALQAGQLHAWLAYQQQQPVGYASATLDFSTWDARRFLHMDCLYLCEAARSRGLGQALLQAVRQFGQLQGCTNLQWQTPDWNQPAMRFYDRTGARALPKQRYRLNL